jgi:ABC-type uncharacterized transport system involved in gliding motility auxiliary subunit
MEKEINKAKTGVNAVGFVVFLLLGLVFLNVISGRIFKRVDFTQDRVYTLSPASKELVAKLPDRLTVKAFFSKDLPPPFSQVAQYARDLLDEYQHASNGKFTWEAVSPDGNKDLEAEAEKVKVPKLRRGRVSSDKVEIGTNYLGVAFQYQGNVESIPEIGSLEGLEFQMSSIIKRLTVKKKKVAFATSEGELSMSGGGMGHPGGLGGVKQYLEDYDVVPVQLNTGAKPISDDVDALVIAGPHQPMSERAKFVIDQFLMKGKSVAFLVDGMSFDHPGGVPGMPGMNQPPIGHRNEADLGDLLGHYGFQIRDDVVLEPKQNAPGPVSIQGQLLIANHPAFVVSTNLASNHSVTDRLKGVILPMASSVELLKDKQPGLEVVPLVSSTPKAWRQSGFFLIDPQIKLTPSTDRGPFALAFAAKGKLKSFFAGKPYPNDKGEKQPPQAENVSLPPGEERVLTESSGTPHLVVVGNSSFASDEFLRIGRFVEGYTANILFFINVVDYLAQDEALSAMRSKGMQSRPLTVSNDSAPSLARYANVIGVPFLFSLYGILRRWRRNARRRMAHV